MPALPCAQDRKNGPTFSVAPVLRWLGAMKSILASLSLLALLATACSNTPPGDSDAASAGPSAGDDDDSEGSGDAAQRAISEADVVQIDEEKGRLYAMSRSGSIAVVDVSTPGRLA